MKLTEMFASLDAWDGEGRLDGSGGLGGAEGDTGEGDDAQQGVYASLADGGSVRQVPPEEFAKYQLPDYPQVKSLPGLVRHFKRNDGDYYAKIKADVQENGFTTPALARYKDPRGTPLKRPVLMAGHHRAAAAYELGKHLPVGDYDNQADQDRHQEGNSAWFRTDPRGEHTAAVSFDPQQHIGEPSYEEDDGYGRNRWDEWHPRLPGTIHRALGVKIPADHPANDRSRPMSERAHSLLGDVANHLGRGGGMGMHWTSDPTYLKKHMADRLSPGETPVMLHARTPPREHIEDNGWVHEDRAIRDWDTEEREVPIKRNAPLHVTGITWGGEHHDFDEPITKRAAMVPTSDVTRAFYQAQNSVLPRNEAHRRYGSMKEAQAHADEISAREGLPPVAVRAARGKAAANTSRYDTPNPFAKTEKGKLPQISLSPSHMNESALIHELAHHKHVSGFLGGEPLTPERRSEFFAQDPGGHGTQFQDHFHQMLADHHTGGQELADRVRDAAVQHGARTAVLTGDSVDGDGIGMECRFPDDAPIHTVASADVHGQELDSPLLREYNRTVTVDTEGHHKTEMVPVHELERYASQPTTGEHAKEVAAHVLRKGSITPLILHYHPKTSEAYLGEGNHRLRMARTLGITHLPVRVTRNVYGLPGPGTRTPQEHPAIASGEHLPADIRPSHLGIGTGTAHTAAKEVHADDADDSIHRGVTVVLPPDVHKFVHDPAQPVAARAHMLLAHTRKEHPEITSEEARGTTGGLGNYWAPSKDKAHEYGAQGGFKAYRDHERQHNCGDPETGYGGCHTTNVVIHAGEPSEKHQWKEVFRPGERYERGLSWRLPIRPDAPLHVRGISWREGDDHESSVTKDLDKKVPYTEHDFPTPVKKRASAPLPRGRDNEGHEVELHPQDGWQHLDGSVSHDDGTTVSDHPVTPYEHVHTWLPKDRYWGPNSSENDQRLFDGDRLRPEIRADILARVGSYLRRYKGWTDWAKVYFAGSEAAMWKPFNGDFDVLIGIDWPRFRDENPAERGHTNEEIADHMTDGMWHSINQHDHFFTINEDTP